MATQTKLEHLTNRDLFSNYYLENLLLESDTWTSVDEDEIKKIFEEIQELYEDNKDLLYGCNESDVRRWFIEPILKELGFFIATEEPIPDSGKQPDFALFKEEKDLDEGFEQKEDGELYDYATSLAEAKRWGRDLDKRGGVRDFTNPSHQVYVYLQDTPVDWAILTNGKKWRLYYTETSHKLDSYYEIDLPSILERDDALEAFKYFYLLFRRGAFVKDKRKECFLDKVYDKSNLFSQELGEDLKENIYEAIRLLSEGFLEFPDNDLDPEDDLDLIHDSSLIYLYRLIFVLYAESEGRDLLNTGNRIYNENYSLNTLKQEVCENLEESDTKYTDWRGKVWDRLEELFVLIDKGSENKGIPRDELYIPAYNGGLFRTEIDEETSKENEFLQNNKVGDSYLAEVIDLLTRHESKNGEGRVFVDYSSLDIRHLGSIYEGLLEYHLNVASEEMIAVKEDKEEKWYSKEEYEGDESIIEELDEGEIYLTTDKGERKATGSYYTPEYIVQYIVENTLDPILDDIREDLLRKEGGDFANDFAERVFELKVLDPAMGSGHFLTNTVDHLAREIVNAHQRQAEEEGAESVDESHDIHWARRQVAQKCIYGVDLNPLAVELSKVSLWLRTLAAQQPLAFLDHHLMTGNSLIGSDIEDIEELDSGKDREDEDTATLEDFGMTWKGTMEDLMSIYQDFIKIENQELSDIKEMEEKFHEFEHEPIKERLEAMANVHTAREFGVDVPDNGFTKMAKAIDHESRWDKIEVKDWFDDAQKLAKERNFFHWKLAFPEVFYEEDGSSLEVPGFDVVIGNPPYVKIQNIDEKNKIFYEKEYQVAKERYDLYGLFVEKADDLSNWKTGFILPNKFFEAKAGLPLRNYLSDKKIIGSIIDFNENQIFLDSTTYTCLLFLDKNIKSNIIDYVSIQRNPRNSLYSTKTKKVDIDREGRKWGLTPTEERKIIEKIENKGKSLHEIAKQILVGIQSSANDIFVLEDCKKKEDHLIGKSKELDKSVKVEKGITKPFMTDNQVKRYQKPETNDQIIYPYDADGKIFSEKELKTNFPKAYEYLEKNRETLSQRGTQDQVFEKWYAHWCPRNPSKFERNKVIISQVVKRGSATYDSKGEIYFSSTVYSPIFYEDYENFDYPILGVLNSTLIWFYMTRIGTVLRGGYYRYKTDYLKDISIPICNQLSDMSSKIKSIIDNRTSLNILNLNLLDYLGGYSLGYTLDEIYIPAQGLSETILTDTQTNRDKLRIGCVDFEENEEALILKASARYKPENEEEFDNLDRWGYTETELIPAMKFTGDEKELTLIREFTKLAVEKAEGFANFRESATKTLSILDRLEKLTLPKLNDVEKGLEKYLEQKKKAKRLEEEIKETEHTIDAIVFNLYDLTEDEVEVVLDRLDTPEKDRKNMLVKFKDIKEG